jgi:hypothetical protein
MHRSVPVRRSVAGMGRGAPLERDLVRSVYEILERTIHNPIHIKLLIKVADFENEFISSSSL